MFLTKREPTFFTRPPMLGFRSLRNEMDRLFDDWAGDLAPMETNEVFRPRINVVENDKHFKVTAELPGMMEKDVEVELSPDYLTLRGKKEDEKTDEGDNWYRCERMFGSFERIIPLPWKIDDEKIKADAVFKNGVLTVSVAKPKELRTKAKKVEVKVA
jgi:HSP20 family protein